MTGSWQPKLQLIHGVDEHGVVSSAFLERSLASGLNELRSESWATSVARSTLSASR